MFPKQYKMLSIITTKLLATTPGGIEGPEFISMSCTSTIQVIAQKTHIFHTLQAGGYREGGEVSFGTVYTVKKG